MPRVLIFFILAWPIAAAFAMYATGIVAIYQSSRVLNLAHGAMAAVPAFLTYTMIHDWHLPLIVGFGLGIASGALLGVVLERLFVRRLRPSGPTAQTVGTIAAFGVLVALVSKVWGTGGLIAPKVFPGGHVTVGDSQLQYGQIGLLVVAVAATVGLTVLFRNTWFGLAMRGAADNRRAAGLMGVNPDRTTAAAWAIGGALAGTAGILLAAVTSLNAYSLSLSVLPAFVAALIGGLESLPGALVGSAVVGLVIGFVPLLSDLPVLRTVIGQVGGAELALTVTAMVVMALRGRRLAGSDVREPFAAIPVRAARAVARERTGRGVLLLPVLVLWVFIPGVPFSLLGDANTALSYTLIGISLVILTGWVGQISLAQAAFVGVGAYSTTFAVLHAGIAFPFTILVAAAVSAGIAVLLGVVALRVRGLYLAVATLIFAWMADSYLFGAPWLTGSGGSISIRVRPIGVRGGYPYFDFGNRRTMYLVALAAASLAIFVASNIRRSKTGRAFFAIRGSEVAAASLGIDVARYKLLAFGLSGALAGVAGNLIATHQQTIAPAQFAVHWSLFYLAVVVVGGLQSTGGVVASAIVFAGLSEVFFRVSALNGWLDVVSSGLLAAVLLFYPGGLPAIPLGVRRVVRRVVYLPAPADGGEPVARFAALARVPAMTTSMLRSLQWAQRAFAGLGREFAMAVRTASRPLRSTVRRGRRATPDVPTLGPAFAGLRLTDGPAANGHVARFERDRAPVVLDASSVTVQFGGLVACDRASVQVHRGEIVGLIGPNGAGKTTLFNAIAGFVAPSDGAVFLDGRDITSLAVHERAALGMGRTFQAIQMFPQLSVFENLLVATHTQDPTGFLAHMVVTRGSAAAERDASARVGAILPVLGLENVAGEPAGSLPFGTLRLVEVGRALVAGSPLVMLDEPASGLDSTETAQFTALLRRIRDHLGLSLLVIEHDISMVMSLCDYVYVLDRGRIIASGPPAVVQADPAVIAAYLGASTPAGNDIGGNEESAPGGLEYAPALH